MGMCMYMWVTLSSYTLHACKIEDNQRSTTFSYINNNKNFILPKLYTKHEFMDWIINNIR